jgi:nucleotide-binding universal stress UspA family protein
MPPAPACAEVGTVNDAPILLWYDGSEGARRAIAAAAVLLGDRPAVVLDVGPLELVAAEYAAFGSEAVALEREALHDAAVRAEAGAQIARTAGLRARGRAELEAPAWRAVVEVADEIGASVIVLGTRGLCGIKALLEGSFSRLVALHAGRPVLVVPPFGAPQHSRVTRSGSAAPPMPWEHAAATIRTCTSHSLR